MPFSDSVTGSFKSSAGIGPTATGVYICDVERVRLTSCTVYHCRIARRRQLSARSQAPSPAFAGEKAHRPSTLLRIWAVDGFGQRKEACASLGGLFFEAPGTKMPAAQLRNATILFGMGLKLPCNYHYLLAVPPSSGSSSDTYLQQQGLGHDTKFLPLA